MILKMIYSICPDPKGDTAGIKRFYFRKGRINKWLVKKSCPRREFIFLKFYDVVILKWKE